MKKFELGRSYKREGLFGPSFWVIVMKRTETTITVVQFGWVMAPEEEWTTLNIEYEDGNEICEVWEYMGYKGYLRA